LLPLHDLVLLDPAPSIARNLDQIEGERSQLVDKQDDTRLVAEAANNDAVKKVAGELDRFRNDLLQTDSGKLRKLFGGSTLDLEKFALPVAQPRTIVLPGLRNPNAETRIDTFAIGDFAALRVWSITDRDKPVAVAIYFAADKTFPRLTAVNLSDRLTWDQGRFDRLIKFVSEKQSASP
jgi:hypothetical protein